MRIAKIFLYCMFLSSIDVLFAMKTAKKTSPSVKAEKHTPVLSRPEVLDDLDGETLSMLCRAVLEQAEYHKKSSANAKLLLELAATKSSPDPQALYLSGHTKSSILAGYIPAIYMCALNSIEHSASRLSNDQQKLISSMIINLKQARLQDETELPLLQKKAVTMYHLDSPPDQQYKITMPTAYSMLNNIMETYFSDPTKGIKPWAIRASYAVGMMKLAGLDMHSAHIRPEQPEYLIFAANEQFEPAIYQLLLIRVCHNQLLLSTLEKQFQIFMSAIRNLKKSASTTMTSDYVDVIIHSSLSVLQFLELFDDYVKDLKLRNDAYKYAMQALEQIATQFHDYRSYCLLAIFQLKSRSYESIMRAFTSLEPALFTVESQSFLAKYTDQATITFLKDHSASDTNAAFMLGFILCGSKSKRQEAYKLFLQGAEKNHFYSLCCTAGLIKKEFDQEKNIYDAVLYYKQALTSAPTQQLKAHVLNILKTLADQGCLSARCQYLVSQLFYPEQQQTCAIIMRTIEEFSHAQFDEHIHYFKSYCMRDLHSLAEQGNKLATRLLGYIYYVKAKESPSNDICSLHTSLGKFRVDCSSERSCTLAGAIAFSLANYYRRTGNEANALRLFTLAAGYHHPKASSLCALMRLKKGTSKTILLDIQQVQELADQGDFESQDLLAKIHCGAITHLNGYVKQDICHAYHYLENLVSHNKADEIDIILLAKILCLWEKYPGIEHNDERAFALYTQAIKLGYNLTKKESRLFGILAFTLQHDQQALTLLESCEHNKKSLWLLSILYLRHSALKEGYFIQALKALSIIFTIKNDTLDLPKEMNADFSFVLETLKQHITANQQALELYLRMCYANGLDHEIIPTHEYIELIEHLFSSATLSAWNFIVLLHRQGIKISDSLNSMLTLLPAILTKSTSNTRVTRELINQLKLIAAPLMAKNLTKLTDDELIAAIKACHFLTNLYYKDDLVHACTYFIKAEEAITSLFTDKHAIYDSAHTIGSLVHLSRLAETQNQDACVALMIYRGFRHSHNAADLEKIASWLHLCTHIMDKKSEYIVGQNKDRDEQMAILYTLIGKLSLILSHATRADDSELIPYFEYALSLDPMLDIPKYYIAIINLHSTKSSITQRRLALKTLHTLAKLGHQEACFALAQLYHPRCAPLENSFAANPNLILSTMYLKKSGHYDALEKQKNWPICNIL